MIKKPTNGSSLPCKHTESVTKQVQPTINLLLNLDKIDPELLLQHSIQPEDYMNSLVFRSAIESIRGSYIASSTTGREAFIGSVLERLRQRQMIDGFQQTSNNARTDFIVDIECDPLYKAAIEVKGGEGNSINISDRPVGVNEFAVWSHLDGAIVNQPSHGAHSIINRLTNELVQREKQVDVIFFKDLLCGTRLRPCPKYPDRSDTLGVNVAPDIFLLPNSIPSLSNPNPPVHTLDTLKLPGLILDLYNVPLDERHKHVWEINVKIIRVSPGRLRRDTEIRHEGKVVDKSKSRSWHI